MWIEYADDFKGICLHFNSRFEIEPIYPYVVTYCDPLPKYNFFEEKENILVKTISTKYKPKYSHEEEVRLFHFGRIKNIHFDCSLLISVIIGEHLLEKNIDKLRELLKRSDLQHVELKKASLINHEEVTIENI